MSIVLKNVAKSFAGRPVISPLSLAFETKRFASLLGPSGCGKTTLLRMIAGLETPDAGEIVIDGKTVFSSEAGVNLPPQARGVSFVFQDFALWPHLTVFENVAFPLRARKDTEALEERVRSALAAVKLEDFGDRSVTALSGGQQQRVGFARAIVAKPSVILFDEPLSALDALLRESMRSEILAVTRRLDMTSVFVTHDRLEAMSMSDDVVVMSGGRVLQKAPPLTVYREPANAFVANFVGKTNWLDARRFFRPEAAVYDRPSGGALALTARVTDSIYMGGRYLVRAAHDDSLWELESAVRRETGAELSFWVSQKDVVVLPTQQDCIV